MVVVFIVTIETSRLLASFFSFVVGVRDLRYDIVNGFASIIPQQEREKIHHGDSNGTW